MNANKRFAELVGICLGNRLDDEGLCLDCGLCIEAHRLPDFTDAREVIKVMRENDMIHKFAENQGWPCKDGHYCVPLHYIYTTGLLRDEAIRFLEERNA